jgi:hypothetical protein
MLPTQSNPPSQLCCMLPDRAAMPQVIAAGLCSAAAAAAAAPTVLQSCAPCGSSGCTYSPSSSSSNSRSHLARQHTACDGAQLHQSACPVGFSCQHQHNQGWLCLPLLQGAAVSAAEGELKPATTTSDVDRRSLAQIIPDSPAVATRTTNTTAADSSAAGGSTAAGTAGINSALAPRAMGEAAPLSNSSAGTNTTTNSALVPRRGLATNETAPGAAGSNSSNTQAGGNTRGALPVANCPAGQTAVGSQCVKSGSIGAASSGGLGATGPGWKVQWLVNSMFLAVVFMFA